MARALKLLIEMIVPPPVLKICLGAYHFSLALVAAVWFGHPSRSLLVVGVTGTKGKTSVTEMICAIFEAGGHTTALMNSIRFKIADASRPNLTRMSMPGRFFIQRFLKEAVSKKCTVAILEMTSEGARQSRHRFLDLDALVFTNLAPEHIESHGSYEAYADAKFEIGKELVRSKKRPRIMVANADDKQASRFLTLPVEHSLPFSLAMNEPHAGERGGDFTFDDAKISIQFPGDFSLKNALAAATVSRALGIETRVIATALGSLAKIPGRAERIEGGQPFTVVVDYAHTPDSLKALYGAYTGKKICLLSSMGGGRDTWKRPIMGRIAEEQCTTVILTAEDPCDEDPRQIVEDIMHGMSKKPEVILDRRAAIRRALHIARSDDVVLITGKGTNHSIMVADGKEIPWDDATVVREELTQLLRAK